MEDKRKRASKEDQEKLAPGMTGVEGLNREATPKEMAEDYSTRVVKLEYDEYDPSNP